MSNKRNPKKINRKLLGEAQRKLDEALELLKPCFEVLSQPSLWPQTKIDSRVIQFLTLSLENSKKYPELFPDYYDIHTFKEDFLSIVDLWLLAEKAFKLRELTDSMVNTAGNNTLETA